MPFDPISKDDRVALVLENAGDLVERGWCRSCPARRNRFIPTSVKSPHARLFCIRGAIQRAAYDHGLGIEIVSAASEAVANLIAPAEIVARDGASIVIMAFNDQRRRRKEEAVQAIRWAALAVQPT